MDRKYFKFSADWDRESNTTMKTSRNEPQRIRLTEIMGAERELVIEHDGDCYRLRLTRANKLLLTK